MVIKKNAADVAVRKIADGKTATKKLEDKATLQKSVERIVTQVADEASATNNVVNQGVQGKKVESAESANEPTEENASDQRKAEHESWPQKDAKGAKQKGKHDQTKEKTKVEVTFKRQNQDGAATKKCDSEAAFKTKLEENAVVDTRVDTVAPEKKTRSAEALAGSKVTAGKAAKCNSLIKADGKNKRVDDKASDEPTRIKKAERVSGLRSRGIVGIRFCVFCIFASVLLLKIVEC